MKTILVASKNPVKMNAALQSFQKMFPDDEFSVEGIAVPSGVADQPMSDEETYQGALNRVNAAKASDQKADYYVGIEGGIEEKNGDMEVFAWIIVCSSEGKLGKARTGTFFLPPVMSQMIREGKELGSVDEAITGRVNSKQMSGTVGFLTHHVMDRTQYYVDATVLALIPFRHEELF